MSEPVFMWMLIIFGIGSIITYLFNKYDSINEFIKNVTDFEIGNRK